jgi:hypothetical protein
MTKRSASETDPETHDAGPANPAGLPSRLVIPLTADGRVDWGRVSGRKKDQVRRTMYHLKRKTPGEPGAAGGEDQAAAAAPAKAADVFSESWAGVVFDVVGHVEQLAVTRIYGCTPEQAALFLYTAEEKALLTGPLTRVLNKYGSQWLAQYADECALAGLVLTLHLGKVQALNAVLEKAAAAPRPRAVADATLRPRATASVDTETFLADHDQAPA